MAWGGVANSCRSLNILLPTRPIMSVANLDHLSGDIDCFAGELKLKDGLRLVRYDHSPIELIKEQPAGQKVNHM